jgi:hypothetical protein
MDLKYFLVRKQRNGKKLPNPPIHAWAGGDVNDFKEEEFDFQANLDMFDKAKVFAEIKVGILLDRRCMRSFVCS